MSFPKDRFPIAAIQMVSSTDVDDNLQSAEALIRQAVSQGAKLVALPEFFCLMGQGPLDKVAVGETAGSGAIQHFLREQAVRHGIWLVGGTLPLRCADPDRIYNTCLVYDPDGDQVARYDKIHLFAFRSANESHDESLSIRAGENAPQSFDSPAGKTGLSICYDLRFPELFRALGQVNLIIVPSAFTCTTGRAHWEVLLRARAIENQCYVLAPAQGGKHANGRRTWGHSMLIDPWGDIIDSIDEGPGVVTGTIDCGRLFDVRERLPALNHRTM